MEKYVFWVMAFLSLGSAILMIRARNPIHSALLLVLNFFTLSVFYVLLDAHFLAAVQVIVYAGAIMVLFLFVIMLLGVDRDDVVEERIPLQYPVAIVLGLAFAGIAVWTLHTTVGGSQFRGVEAANQGGNVEAVGRVLFTKYMFPFEVASVLLIVAAVAAMVLGRRREEEEAASLIGDSTPDGREPAREQAKIGDER